MAIGKITNKVAGTTSKLKNIGVDTSQLSTALNFVEKTQINSIKNVGSISSTAGKLGGDVTKAIANLNATQRSAMDLGASLSAKLEDKGVFSKNVEGLVSSAVKSSVQSKVPLPQEFPELPVDLSNWKNRVPSKFKTVAEKVQRSKESLIGRADFRYGGITYPPELVQEASAYLKLQFFKYTRGTALTPGSMSDIEYVEWPLPDNFSLNYNVKYQERDTGIMGDVMATETMKNAITAADQQAGLANKFNAVKGSMTDSFGALTGDDALEAAGRTAMRAGFAGLEGMDESAGGLAGQIIGSIPNPHPTVFFKGVELRQFQWTWKFVPRSKAEAEALEKSIAFIKKMILPEQDGNFLKYPHFIQPQVKGDNVAMYGNFKKAMVSSFSVNYTGEGQSAFYVDGQPVSIICAMTFQETENFTAEDA